MPLHAGDGEGRAVVDVAVGAGGEEHAVGEARAGADAADDLAGVQVDDLIVGFNGAEIRSMQDLAAAVRLQAPNAVVEVVVIRDGGRVTLTVTLGTLPS